MAETVRVGDLYAGSSAMMADTGSVIPLRHALAARRAFS